MRDLKKIGISISILLLIIIVGILCLNVNRVLQKHFNGSIIKNSDLFQLDFTYMNQNDEHIIYLEKGDILHVDWDINKGQMAVSVGISDKKPIYEGNHIDSKSDFDINVQESGDYVITVQASNAAGTMKFQAEE